VKTRNTTTAIIAAGFASIFLFASCQKKDYTCACKFSNSTTSEVWLGYMSNNAAQKKCNDHQENLTKNSTGTGIVSQCKVIY
jgi:hypothetical protein